MPYLQSHKLQLSEPQPHISAVIRTLSTQPHLSVLRNNSTAKTLLCISLAITKYTTLVQDGCGRECETLVVELKDKASWLQCMIFEVIHIALEAVYATLYHSSIFSSTFFCEEQFLAIIYLSVPSRLCCNAGISCSLLDKNRSTSRERAVVRRVRSMDMGQLQRTDSSYHLGVYSQQLTEVKPSLAPLYPTNSSFRPG